MTAMAQAAPPKAAPRSRPAAPKNPPAAAQKGDKPAPAADEGVPDSPYAAEPAAMPQPEAETTAPAAADAPPGAAPSDPKLDEPPPRAGDVGGPKLSPLNPEPAEFPSATKPTTAGELTKLLSDIAALRSRVSALTTSLFSSKVRLVIAAEGDDARIDSLALLLDDGVVYRAPARFVADEERVVFEHAVAPGNHVLGVQIERHDARGTSYKTWQESKFSIVVPDRQLLEIELLLEDDSDMASEFPDDRDGEYELGVRLRARVVD